MTNTPFERATELIEQITYHDRLYFTENRQEISDEAYDSLWFELKQILEDRDSDVNLRKLKMPLGHQKSFLDKVRHLMPILSLDKIKSLDEATFRKDIRKFMKKYPSATDQYVLESKLDGLTIVMYKMKDGKIVFATRGGSIEGEDVTSQFINDSKTYEAAKRAPEGMIIRGEAIISKQSFESMKDNYSNARNAASGAVRSKAENSAQLANVEFVAYDIMSSHSKGEYEDLLTLEKLGFNVVKYELVHSESLEDRVFEATRDDWRSSEKYDIDGLVIKPVTKVEGVYDGDGHHAKGQLAVKFPPKGAPTVLRDVEFTIGKDGRMTPVAIFDPIEIDGVTSSRASLGSWTNFLKFDMKLGDEIYVIRSNDVIPQVQSVLVRHEDSKSVTIPENAYLVDAHLYTDIEETLANRVAKFAKAMKIKSMNSKGYEKLIEAGLIENYSDLYHLASKRDAMMQIKGFSDKKIQSLLDEIEFSRNYKFEDLINGSQLRALGGKTSKKIAKLASSIDELLKLDIDEVIQKCSLNVNAEATMRKLFDTNSDEYRLIKSLEESINS